LSTDPKKPTTEEVGSGSEAGAGTHAEISKIWPTTGSASVHIAATAKMAYAYVTDLDKAPNLSPENQKCVFTGDSTKIVEGATFKGTNKAGDYEWSVDCVVVAATPGETFAFTVPPNWEYATTWTYTFAPDADGKGVTVTESFDSPMLADPDIYPGQIEGRCEQLTSACAITLNNLKIALET